MINETAELESASNSNCVILKIFGVYTVVLLISSTVLNSLNLWLFYKAKLYTPLNVFMITLIGFNFIGGLLETPLIIYKGFNCQ